MIRKISKRMKKRLWIKMRAKIAVKNTRNFIEIQVGLFYIKITTLLISNLLKTFKIEDFFELL